MNHFRSSKAGAIAVAVVAAALIAGMGSPLVADAASPAAAITGRVLSNGGDALKGIMVQAKSTSGELYSTSSDAKGRFYLTGLEKGTYGLKFSDRLGVFPCPEGPCEEGRTPNGITEWLGDSPTFSGSKKITISAGEKHTGVRALVDTYARLSGPVTVNGHRSTTADHVVVDQYRNGKEYGGLLTEGSWFTDADRVGNYRFRVSSTTDAFAPFWIVDPRDGNTTFHLDRIEKITGIAVTVTTP